MAISPTNEQMDQLDLAVHHLQTNETEILPNLLQGYRPNSPVGLQKIRFYDHGGSVDFALALTPEKESMHTFYRFQWQTGSLLRLKEDYPSKVAGPFSDDNLYFLQGFNLMNNDEQVVMKNIMNGYGKRFWLKNTHILAGVVESTAQDKARKLLLTDVDKKTIVDLPIQLNSMANLVGQSQDGQWIYVTTNGTIEKN